MITEKQIIDQSTCQQYKGTYDDLISYLRLIINFKDVFGNEKVNQGKYLHNLLLLQYVVKIWLLLQDVQIRYDISTLKSKMAN